MPKPCARLLLIVFFCHFGACASIPLASSISRLKKLDVPVGGQRPINALDATGDGRIDDVDVRIFNTLSNEALALLKNKGVEFDVRHNFYPGPPKTAPHIFSLVSSNNGEINLDQVPENRLLELHIESGWAASQAHLAKIALAPVSDANFGGFLSKKFVGFNADKMEPNDLCVAIQQFDRSLFDKAKVPLVAILDLDSTVWAGDVSIAFLGVLAEKAIINEEVNESLKVFLKSIPGIDASEVDKSDASQNAKLLHKLATDKSLPKKQRVNAKDLFYNTVALLKGLTLEQVMEVASTLFHEGGREVTPFKQRIFTDQDGCGIMEMLAQLNKKEIEVYFLSATLDFLAVQGAKFLGFSGEKVLGSQLELEKGVFTGKVSNSTYYTKGALTRQWLDAPPLLVFGDSPSSDFSMLLEATGLAVMVNPRARLKARDKNEAGSRFTEIWFDSTIGELQKQE